MTTFVFANNVNTTLAGSISSSATSLTLASANGLPSSIPAGCCLALTLNDAATKQNFEIVYATAVSGATLSGLLRGQEGTPALAWNVGDFSYSAPTEGQMRNAIQLPSTGKRSYFSNSTFTAPPGVTVGYLTGSAGGAGGGAGGSNNISNAAASCGGGGGAGQSVIRQQVTLVPGQVYNLIIGAFGAGGTAPGQGVASGSAQVGAAGGPTSFGTLLTLAGGSGGAAGIAGASSGAIAGGSGGSGFPNGGTASDGSPAPVIATIYSWPGVSGAGGSSPFGGGGPSVRCANSASIHGNAAGGFGAGGGGGGSPYGAGSAGGAGGNGTQGFITIEW